MSLGDRIDEPGRLREGLAELGVEEATLLAGDASTRRYLRGRHRGSSVIVMDCGDAIPEADAFPFARWLSFYTALGIRVPRLLALDAIRGLVLLEDLGDDVLQARLERTGALACRAHYERAVEWGLRLGLAGTRRFQPDPSGSDDPLVPARLAIEMDLFLVHASGVALPSSTESLPALRRASLALDAACAGGCANALARARSLLHELCLDVHGPRAAPRAMTLCHRDYHARNLLLVPGIDRADDVAVIDFQDTRRGPRAYDLASLAWDPYVTLPQALIDDLVEAWRPAEVPRDAWLDEVALAAGQRLVKAAGSYAWLGHGCGRTQYLQWLEPALARAHERLEGWAERDALWGALADCGALPR